jgi:hypothetical protein
MLFIDTWLFKVIGVSSIHISALHVGFLSCIVLMCSFVVEGIMCINICSINVCVTFNSNQEEVIFLFVKISSELFNLVIVKVVSTIICTPT